MMKTLYEILGVTPDANHETIRRAYRHHSKRMHPDAGGDADAFKAFCQAHEVLSDPERRAYYDQTGKISSAVDNSTSYVLEAIDRAFNAVAVKLAMEKCRDMNVIDMLQQMRLHLGAEETRLRETVEAFAHETVMLEELADRFSITDDGENFVAKLLQTKIATLKEKVQMPVMELEATLGAIEEMKRYTFERRFVTPPPAANAWGYGTNSPYIGGLTGGNSP